MPGDTGDAVHQASSVVPKKNRRRKRNPKSKLSLLNPDTSSSLSGTKEQTTSTTSSPIRQRQAPYQPLQRNSSAPWEAGRDVPTEVSPELEQSTTSRPSCSTTQPIPRSGDQQGLAEGSSPSEAVLSPPASEYSLPKSKGQSLQQAESTHARVVPFTPEKDLDTKIPGAEPRPENVRPLTTLGRPNDDAKPRQAPFVIEEVWPYAVRIMSPQVFEFIEEGLPYYPAEVGALRRIVKPYEPLVFNYDRLAHAVADGKEDKDGNKSTRAQLEVVLNWLQPHYTAEILPELEAHKLGKATFESLWILFKPGTIVCKHKDHHLEFYVVQSCVKNFHKLFDTWTLRVWRFYFMDRKLTRRAIPSVLIRSFSGERDISALPLVPLQHAECSEDLQQRLIARGKHHCTLVNQSPRLQQYNGALSGNRELLYSGAVLIDPVRYTQIESVAQSIDLWTIAEPADGEDLSRLEEPEDEGGGPLYSRFNDIPLGDAVPFEEDKMYLLIPGRIWGFATGKKQWAQFDVARLRPSETSGTAMSNLVMDSTDLDLLRALGTTKTKTTHIVEQTDFVDGKGSGRVILLHGPPGVGKSFTVECFAQDMGRPLLALTAADIGTDPSIVEQRLSAWLDLAQRWNAIVLLDEADTYLDAREAGDLVRNALVSALLRVLEYYPSTIFFTTNRLGPIDEAFISRLHLCIEYPSMSRSTQNEIWQNFFNKFEKEQKKGSNVSIPSTMLNYVTAHEDFKDMQLNGRDIRNVFQAAIDVATQRARKTKGPTADVEVAHRDFQQVMNKKHAFKAYLDKVDGLTAARRAYDKGNRKDEPAGK